MALMIKVVLITMINNDFHAEIKSQNLGYGMVTGGISRTFRS